MCAAYPNPLPGTGRAQVTQGLRPTSTSKRLYNVAPADLSGPLVTDVGAPDMAVLHPAPLLALLRTVLDVLEVMGQ